LSGEEPTQRAIGISKTQFQIIRDVRQGWAVKTRAARKVPFEETPRLAPGGRRARLDVEARLARALQENTVAARMIYLRRRGAEPRPTDDGHRPSAQPRNLLAMDVE